MVNDSMLIAFLMMFSQTASDVPFWLDKTPPPDIATVRIASTSNNGIKPCQPFSVIFDVTSVNAGTRQHWLKIARRASRLVRVDGAEYLNRLSGSSSLNDACQFNVLWPEPTDGDPPLQSSDQALISAECQADLKQRACLFQGPGERHLEFFFGEQSVSVTVEVAAPTQDERRIFERLNTIEMLIFMLEPTDRQHATPDNIRMCEELLQIPSDYSTILTLTLGVAKRHRVKPDEWTEEQTRNYYLERLRLLEPITRVPLTTRLAAQAATDFATVAGELARMEIEVDKKEAYLKLSEQMWHKVAECPLLPGEQNRAKEIVKAAHSRASP